MDYIMDYKQMHQSQATGTLEENGKEFGTGTLEENGKAFGTFMTESSTKSEILTNVPTE